MLIENELLQRVMAIINKLLEARVGFQFAGSCDSFDEFLMMHVYKMCMILGGCGSSDITLQDQSRSFTGTVKRRKVGKNNFFLA